MAKIIFWSQFNVYCPDLFLAADSSSITHSVRRSVRPSVGRSVRRSVRLSKNVKKVYSVAKNDQMMMVYGLLEAYGQVVSFFSS